MEIVKSWTGRTACILQGALRLTNEQFAEQLGISTRTVVRWHSNPDLAPRTEMQQLLDTTFARAGEEVRHRFGLLSRPAEVASQAQALRVAIAVVRRGSEVLLVCRQDGADMTWQFPAGIVKPGGSAQKVAVRETLDETGVHCMIREHLGERLHPRTRAWCDYFVCDYVHGEAVNGDASENAAVAWAPIGELARYIPEDQIYPPILEALEAAA
ncbi:NUDIX hydrolase [Streptomyces sp. NPDC058296]|uniref:NUDIX hydrolase n=1 Tax=Streptomyces sp. NPDC058296 TaxID=3346432 RepID=UPI0036E2505E